MLESKSHLRQGRGGGETGTYLRRPPGREKMFVGYKTVGLLVEGHSSGRHLGEISQKGNFFGNRWFR